jgi:hypothetical protein
MNYLFFILAAVLALTAQSVRADDPAVPGAGFPASRYEVLWTKSPFAVATPEAAADSPDYSLVLVAQIDGVSYASLIEKQNGEHFLISSDKSVRGLKLTSITRNPNSPDTYALVQKDGQTITLKLEQGPTVGAGMPSINMPPGMVTQQIQMPGAGNPMNEQNQPFRPRFRRALIHLPPQPGQQQAVQFHTPPPSQQ